MQINWQVLANTYQPWQMQQPELACMAEQVENGLASHCVLQ